MTPPAREPRMVTGTMRKKIGTSTRARFVHRNTPPRTSEPTRTAPSVRSTAAARMSRTRTICMIGAPNAAAQARRAQAVEHGTRSSSRRCLEPPGWTSSTSYFLGWNRLWPHTMLKTTALTKITNVAMIRPRPPPIMPHIAYPIPYESCVTAP